MSPSSSSSQEKKTDTASTSAGATSVEALKEMILQLQIQLADAKRSKVKIEAPKAFSGNKQELRGFVTTVRAYFLHYPDQFTTEDSQVMFAASRLEGDALAWFEPILRDKIENNMRHWKESTKAAFKSFDGFEEALKEAFGDPDETQSAERQLHQLHQKGPASDYAAKFRQVAAHLEWDDDPLMVAFYQGLKDEVKDELIKEDRPNTLAEYIATAVKIDDRLYERRQEKRKNGGGGWKQFKNNTNAANAKAKRRHPSTAYGHHSGPMEIDMAQKKFGKPKGKCYNCNKEGHFARECRAPKKLGWKPVPDDRNRQVNLAEANHASLTWTACFRDDCTTHKSDKEAAGWYPKRPKGKRSINMAFRATQGQEYEYDFRRDPRYRAFRLQELATQGHTQEEASQILSSQDLPTYPRRLPARNPNAAPRQLLREATIGNDAIDAVRIRSILAEDIHQRAAVRQDPEEAETIVISGVPTKQVRLREHDEGPMFGDDPRMCHRDEKHEEISWVSCFCNACLDHLEDKTKHNWFPRRYRNQPVPNPYLKEELRYWTTRSRIGEAPYVILRPDPKYPWLCRMGGLRRECTTIICAYHARGKIEDWHEVGGHDEIERLRQIQR